MCVTQMIHIRYEHTIRGIINVVTATVPIVGIYLSIICSKTKNSSKLTTLRWPVEVSTKAYCSKNQTESNIILQMGLTIKRAVEPFTLRPLHPTENWDVPHVNSKG